MTRMTRHHGAERMYLMCARSRKIQHLMESGIVIGDLKTSVEMKRIGGSVMGRQGVVARFPRSPRTPVSLSARLFLSAGFTLLELMIVISIIIILAAIT